MSAVNDWSNTN